MLYAVGLKGWVEIREASTPPHRHTSTLKVPYTQTLVAVNGRDAWGYTTYTIRDERKERKLSHVAYSGGKVLGCLSKRRFARRYGMGVPIGTCLPIPVGLTAQILEECRAAQTP